MLELVTSNHMQFNVCTSTGTTPLHVACQHQPASFLPLLLAQDVNALYMVDYSGRTPLSYVPKSKWDEYVHAIQGLSNVHWPTHKATPIVMGMCHTKMLPEDLEACEIAQQVSSGRADPADFFYCEASQAGSTDDCTFASSDQEFSVTSFSNDDDSYYADEEEFDEDEDDMLLSMLPVRSMKQ